MRVYCDAWKGSQFCRDLRETLKASAPRACRTEGGTLLDGGFKELFAGGRNFRIRDAECIKLRISLRSTSWRWFHSILQSIDAEDAPRDLEDKASRHFPECTVLEFLLNVNAPVLKTVEEHLRMYSDASPSAFWDGKRITRAPGKQNVSCAPAQLVSEFQRIVALRSGINLNSVFRPESAWHNLTADCQREPGGICHFCNYLNGP